MTRGASATAADRADLPSSGTHLFTVRLWPEELGGGRTDWRGSIRHVSSGELRYFRDWPALEAFVEEMIAAHLAPEEGA